MDDFLEGGLPRGAVSEWGMPLGTGGRELLLPWLAPTVPATTTSRTQEMSLWVYSRSGLMIYPPAWEARGVSLRRVRFAHSTRPLVDLKPVFLEPFFQLIVLDGPRSFSEEDSAFLARQARANGQAILLLRDFFLGPKRGNVWAKLRLNCWLDLMEATPRFHLKVVRGLSPRQIAIDAKTVMREREE